MTTFHSMKTSDSPTIAPRPKSVLASWPLALFACALLVRLVGIDWGLPSPSRWSSYHPDELQTVASVLQLDFFSGQFNPHFFNYPSLYLYLAYMAHTLAAGLGLTHSISNANATWALQHDIILWARVVSALLGAATVPLVYLVAREVAGVRVALLAGVLMCFAPAHVQHSHFATVDVAATFFVALSLCLATRALRSSPVHEYSCSTTTRCKWLLWSAFAAGLAAATKYNAALVVIAPLVSLWLLPHKDTDTGQVKVDDSINKKTKNQTKKSQLKDVPRDLEWPRSVTKTNLLLQTIPLLLLAACGGFLLGCPFSVLSFNEFWGDGLRGGVNGFAYELLVHPRGGSGDIFQDTGNGWWYHLSLNLPFAVSMPVLCLSIWGLAMWLKDMFLPTRRAGAGHSIDSDKSVSAVWPCAVFTLFYFLALGFSQVRFLRYTLLLLPSLCLFAALGTRFLTQLLASFSAANRKQNKQERNTMLNTVASAILSLLVVVATLDVLWPLTRPDPRDQAAAYIRTHTGEAPIRVGLADASSPLWFFTPPLWPSSAPPGSGISLQQALALPPRYRLVFKGADAAQLRATKPAWFLINEFQWRDKERLGDAEYARFRQALEQDYEPALSFRNALPFALPGRAFVPYDFLYTNPEERVYKRKLSR